MKEITLYTAQQPVKKITERTLYITLLSVELYSYGIAHSMHDDLKWPRKLAIKYIEYNGTYLKRFQTQLRNFHGKEVSFFKNNKNTLIESFEKELKDAIDKTINEITQLVFKKKQKITERSELPVVINSKANNHAHKNIKTLINHILQAPSDHEKTIFVPSIPVTNINKIENRIIEIAEKVLKNEALVYAEKRANLNGEKFIFKKLVKNIDEIFNDFMFDKKTSRIKKELLENKMSDIYKEVVKKYEVIGNSDYLLNENKFKAAIEGNFKPKIENLKKG